MRYTSVLAAIGVFTLGVVAGQAGGTPGASSEPRVTTLQFTPLASEFTPGREIRIDLIEFPPNATLHTHRHPGEEFHYYLEGEVVVEIEGKAAIIAKPGTTGHVPYKARHSATAGNAGAKVIAFRVHTQGEPWRLPER